MNTTIYGSLYSIPKQKQQGKRKRKIKKKGYLISTVINHYAFNKARESSQFNTLSPHLIRLIKNIPKTRKKKKKKTRITCKGKYYYSPQFYITKEKKIERVKKRGQVD